MIKNIPENLNSRLIGYAKRLAGENTDPNEVAAPFNFHSEFIEWHDCPEAWAGPWAEKYALAVLSDHSLMTRIDTYDVQMAKREHSARTSAYNLPGKYKAQFLRTRSYGGKPVGCSSLTYAECQKIRLEMSVEEIAAWDSKVDKSIASSRLDMGGTVHFEKPVRIYMFGNDDTSYSLVLETQESALGVLAKLRETPTWENLNSLGFIPQ